MTPTKDEICDLTRHYANNIIVPCPPRIAHLLDSNTPPKESDEVPIIREHIQCLTLLVDEIDSIVEKAYCDGLSISSLSGLADVSGELGKRRASWFTVLGGVRMIPAEIISEIVAWASSGIKDTINLSFISRFWRSAIVYSPDLWSFVDLKFGMVSRRELIDIILERSGEQLLDLQLTILSSVAGDLKLNCALLDSTRRWKTFELRIQLDHHDLPIAPAFLAPSNSPLLLNLIAFQLTRFSLSTPISYNSSQFTESQDQLHSS